ncbi:hypothetical protein [uncultured Eubacterium sp.]|uniref:hypothetical protein n=1 Tax=uncultured Eubacterium sp. TaxID=165185 RepID=UPI002805A701|nr:hypothetical protein [uncultured Eubacterium sp.]
MKKIFTILGMTILGCLCFTACNSSKVENKSDEVVITQNKSICDGIMVACENEDEYGKIFYYDYKSKKEIYACSQANCNHKVTSNKAGDIKCNAIIKGKVEYPFIYNERLYYIVNNNEKDYLWSSKTDGTDKKKEKEFKFPIFDNGEYVLKSGKMYIASKEDTFDKYDIDNRSGEGTKSDVYEINLKTNDIQKMTDFGEAADAYCESIQFFENKLFIKRYSRMKNYKEAGFKDVEHFLAWMESKDFSYKKQIGRLQEEKRFYTYDFNTKKVEKLDINFESNFEDYKGIEAMDGAYYLLCCKNNVVYYYDAVLGKNNIYSYDINKKQRKEIFSSFKNIQAYSNNKIYITSLDIDEKTKNELVPMADINKEPTYYIYDIDNQKLIRQNFGKGGVIYYPIDRNDDGLLVYETKFDAAYDSIDLHSVMEIPNKRIKEK